MTNLAMTAHHASPLPTPSVLATDLDGTLIPLNHDPQNLADLKILGSALAAADKRLVFVTGRHFTSVLEAIQEHALPCPDWILCDVGTSIYRRMESGEFVLDESYCQHLETIVQDMPVSAVHEQMGEIPGVRRQEAEKQGRFKLSYYAPAQHLQAIAEQMRQVLRRCSAPYNLIASVDPFNGDGLVDLLPAGVSKAYALQYWARSMQVQPEEIVFAGDSGNDTAALTAGYRAILVANADRRLARQVADHHRSAGWSNRLFLAPYSATSGVLEGCRWFGLVEHPAPRQHPYRLGATPVADDRTHFRVWAPNRRTVQVEVQSSRETRLHTLEPDEEGFFSGTVHGAGVGDRYRYWLDDALIRPDPASRWQPDGVHGPSEIVDWRQFPWTDQPWKGVVKRDLVIYELHVGTFTEQGTFRAAIDRLPDLVDLGITAVELMPVAQTPGRWNWGYDGVDLFAPNHSYGSPDDLRALVDACHACGLAVILDVVYNHVGPEGNYLADFGPYFSTEYHTCWGEAFAFDGMARRQVRQFVIENAIRWLDEYHFDGIRLDAVHCMYDRSRPHILADLRRAVAAYAVAQERTIHLIAESNVYDAELLLPTSGGAAYDGIWVDCLMLSIYSCAVPELKLTNREYRGPEDVAVALRRGFVYQWDGRRARRAAEHASSESTPQRDSIIQALQTHDAVGNEPRGRRIHQLVSKDFQRAAAPLVLLNPGIPMVFMGEPEASAAPFPFFADFEDPALRASVDEGRMREYPRHDWQGSYLPHDAAAFRSAKMLDRDADMWSWYRALLHLRRQGVEEGWLRADRLQAAWDPNRSLFVMQYSAQDGSCIAIQVRFSGGGVGSEPIPLDIPAHRVLLASQTLSTNRDGCLVLPVNCSVIARSVAEGWLESTPGLSTPQR